ncbi:hypothetical protein D3C87_2045340 [compost metagenome]
MNFLQVTLAALEACHSGLVQGQKPAVLLAFRAGPRADVPRHRVLPDEHRERRKLGPDSVFRGEQPHGKLDY